MHRNVCSSPASTTGLLSTFIVNSLKSVSAIIQLLSFQEFMGTVSIGLI